jgi:hypothetical protein
MAAVNDTPMVYLLFLSFYPAILAGFGRSNRLFIKRPFGLNFLLASLSALIHRRLSVISSPFYENFNFFQKNCFVAFGCSLMLESL